MSGIPDHNRPAFHQAAAELRAAGWTVHSPVELADTTPPRTWVEWMEEHLAVLASGRVQALVLLPGWQASKGARLEVAVARALGLDIHPLADCTDPL